MIFKDMERIVFAGDSVADMGSANPVGEGLFDNVGRGINGHTSRNLLERFDRDVVNLNPDWVSICIGINDVWRQFDSPAIVDVQVLPDEYESNLEQMIVRIKEKVKGIFILSPYII